MLTYINGFLISFGLIVAIGAQNAYVLKQGLTKNHAYPVATLCFLIDAALIILGISGFGKFITTFPGILKISALTGAGILIIYAIFNLRAIFQRNALNIEAITNTQSLKKTLLSTMAISLFNPHVYLDTVLLIGSVSTQYDHSLISFTAGAISASFIWFYGLVTLSQSASQYLTRPKVWSIINTSISLVMLFVACQLIIFALNLPKPG